MENASKALIIAGAILVAILLIGVGVLIINSTGKVTDQVGTTSDTYAVQTFNEQFTAYEGTKTTPSQVRALISLIKSSNAANGFTTNITAPNNSKTDKYVWLYDSNGGITNASQVLTNKTYSVQIGTYSPGGYANMIAIMPNP